MFPPEDDSVPSDETGIDRVAEYPAYRPYGPMVPLPGRNLLPVEPPRAICHRGS